MRVHIVAFTDSAIRFNIVSWFRTTDWNQFLRIRHELFLQFMRIVRGRGASFAFPSRVVYHVTGKDGDGRIPNTAPVDG